MKREGYLISGKRIDVYIPDKVNYAALENVYDVCNELFMNDYAECFYTSSEVKKLKKDKGNTFLRKGEGKAWSSRNLTP